MEFEPDQVRSDVFSPPVIVPAGAPVHLRVEVDFERLYFAYRIEGREWSRLPGPLDASILSDKAALRGRPILPAHLSGSVVRTWPVPYGPRTSTPSCTASAVIVPTRSVRIVLKRKSADMSKIVIITGDGGESYEALYAVHRFEEEGWKAEVAAPSRRRLNLVMHDFKPGWDTYIERRGYGMEADLTFDEVKVEEYAAVLVLGGRAPEYLRNNPKVIEIVREFDRRGKWVFAICHGVQVLATAGLIRGKRVTCYEHVRPEAEQAGATYVGVQTARDGHLVTAQTWQSHPSFYREIFAQLSGKASAARS